MNVHILGAATTKFGELWDVSPRRLAKEAVALAMAQAEVDPEHIDALYVGNMLSGLLGRQEHLGAFFADELGFRCAACKVEGACASGALAVHNAVNGILSGQYRTVLVLGIEKMTDHKPDDVASALVAAGSESERLSGVTFPGLYAILARAHMRQYGTSEEDMAAVAVKNHYHAHLNPNAQFRNLLTVETVMKSAKVADPIKLLDSSPISDGAAALVLSGSNSGHKRKKRIDIVASHVATDTLSIADRASFTELAATRSAGRRAFEQAGIEAKDIDIAEVHDCFTIAEILAMEDLGFYKKGDAGAAVARGETQLGSSIHLVVNTSGGLKGCGHPIGATGVKQVVEIFDQLMGTGNGRQVKDARIGLAHNVGGSGATAVVHILKSYG